jgi:hypothetical protein
MANAFNTGFSLEKIERQLKAEHRDVMLDLVLIWGTLDGVLGMLTSIVLNRSMTEGAKDFGKVSGTRKFHLIISELKKREECEPVVTSVKRHKKSYKKHSSPRDKIAHGHCAGFSKDDPDYVIFAKFEKAGDDTLAMDAVPLDEMKRAIRWGEAFVKAGLKIVDRFDMQE